MIWFWIVLGVMLLLIVIAIMVVYVLLRLSKARVIAATDRFPDAHLIIPAANFFGQESRGKTQMRGNGTLVITDDQIYFEQWVPRRELIIPRSAIQKVENPASFLGKSQKKPLLKIVFRYTSGQEDAAAWRVPDLERVMALFPPDQA